MEATGVEGGGVEPAGDDRRDEETSPAPAPARSRLI